MKKISEYLKIKEAAKLLGVSAGTLRNWEKDGKISSHRNPHSNYRLYKHEDLQDLLNQMENTNMKEHTEQEKLALEVCNKIRDWHSHIMEMEDLYMSDISAMSEMACKLSNMFNLTSSGYISDTGELHHGCGGDLVFEDDPKAYKIMKDKHDKMKEES